jgi:hypothetical protein
MLLFAVLGVAAYCSLSDSTMRVVTLAVIGSFAARTYLAHRNRQRAESEAVSAVAREEQGGGLK